MRTGRTTVAALLAVVAVLLGLNLLLPDAGAWPAEPMGACCNPNGTCADAPEYWCDDIGGSWQGEGTTCSHTHCPDLLTPPTVVAGEAIHIGSWIRLFRFWSDGSVDLTQVGATTGQCPPSILCGPSAFLDGACRADVTRDGDVAVEDFLEVIGHWGPCD